MVLGQEGVFSRGGPEQRAVHKECGMERRNKAGQAAATLPDKQPRKRVGTRHRGLQMLSPEI